MQHDLFHIYTVDAHTLNLIKHLRKLQYTPVSEKFPLASKLMGRLPKPELIYLAGLYHDIGKGRQGDHSELGAVDAQKFCERHQLPAWDSRLIVWLVLNHLVMSTTAQRKDLSDPQVINDFALHVGDETRLDYLYVLTVADINATNPSLWNSWRASLLRQLYSETKRACAAAWKTRWTAKNRFARPSLQPWTSLYARAPTRTMSSNCGRSWAMTTFSSTTPAMWPGTRTRSCSNRPMAGRWC